MTPSLGFVPSPPNPHEQRESGGWALVGSNHRPPACRSGKGVSRSLQAFYGSAFTRHDPRLDPESAQRTAQYPGVRPGVPWMCL
jgi:hypothetical protein